ncbi:MAG: hypothetical protein GX604_08970 [Actinobacteria bacterium]|nr:hypothetical protein [Actinomycetota bacterium]
MSLSVHSYETSESVAWDALVDESRNGTFLHTRRFLSYHGDRFNDASLVIRDKKQRLVGVFPAAIDPGVSDRIVSHPGITYGGIVHNGSLRGERMVEALAAICAAYRNAGMRTLQYKVVPYIYHRFPSEDELYALFRLGAHRCRCELSSTLDLENRLPFAREKRQSIRQAERNDLSVEEGPHLLAHSGWWWLNVWLDAIKRPQYTLYPRFSGSSRPSRQTSDA